MHLQTVKTAADLPFKGIELVKVDKLITEIVIGGKLRIRKGESYSPGLQILIDAPFETATRYRVTAEMEGFDPKVLHFESEYEAKRSAEDFESKGAKAVCEKVDVLIDDAGNVAAATGAPAKQIELDDLPF